MRREPSAETVPLGITETNEYDGVHTYVCVHTSIYMAVLVLQGI